MGATSAEHDRTDSRAGSPGPTGRLRVVLLASGQGSLADSVLTAFASPDSPVEVRALVVDRECAAREVGRRHAVPVHLVRPQDHPDRAAWDAALAGTLAATEPDWVVSAGFMRILGAATLARFPGRVLNTHPALLPSFPGAHGVRDALAYGVTVTGCTVHVVDAGVDTGPIVAQRPVEVRPGDTEATLHDRIKVVERALLVDVLTTVARGGIRLEGRKVVPL